MNVLKKDFVPEFQKTTLAEMLDIQIHTFSYSAEIPNMLEVR